MTLNVEDFRDIHADEPCVLLGNGPSLDDLDVTRLKMASVGMNRSWRKVVSPYHCIFSRMVYLHEIDDGLWAPETLFVASTPAEEVLRWMKLHIGMTKVVLIPLASSPRVGWTNFPSRGWWPLMTGVFALRVASFLGFNPIYLSGYDCNNDEAHFTTHDTKGPFTNALDRPQGRGPELQVFTKLKKVLDIVQPDLRIYNLSPDSAIKCWPTVDISQVMT